MSKVLGLGLFIFAVFAMLIYGMYLGAVDAQGKKEPTKKDQGKKDPPKIDVKVTSLSGKEITHKKGDLKKFDKEMPHHPPIHPPHKEGGYWRWHQYHGWVWLTGVAPAQIVLPLSYSLPESVIIYQAEPTYSTVVCPHCGGFIRININ